MYAWRTDDGPANRDWVSQVHDCAQSLPIARQPPEKPERWARGKGVLALGYTHRSAMTDTTPTLRCAQSSMTNPFTAPQELSDGACVRATAVRIADRRSPSGSTAIHSDVLRASPPSFATHLLRVRATAAARVSRAGSSRPRRSRDRTRCSCDARPSRACRACGPDDTASAAQQAFGLCGDLLHEFERGIGIVVANVVEDLEQVRFCERSPFKPSHACPFASPRCGPGPSSSPRHARGSDADRRALP